MEILNISSEDRGESLLNISLEEVLATDAVNETAVIDDKINRISRS